MYTTASASHGVGVLWQLQFERLRGSLLGGAVGDALGAAEEFQEYDDIVARFGYSGIQEFASAYGPVGAIADETKTTPLTAEGVLRW